MSELKKTNILMNRMLRINQNRPLHLTTCDLGHPWSTSSDNHRVFDICYIKELSFIWPSYIAYDW